MFRFFNNHMSTMGYSYYSGINFPRIGTINYFNNAYNWGYNTGFSTNYSYYNGRTGYSVY